MDSRNPNQIISDISSDLDNIIFFMIVPYGLEQTIRGVSLCTYKHRPVKILVRVDVTLSQPCYLA